jgi:superfamily II DNA or RNA helicase
MSISANDLADGVVLSGSLFSEAMQVIGNPTSGDGFVMVNLVGTRSKTFRGGVTLTKADLNSIEIERPEAQFGAKPKLVKLAVESLRISLAQEYDPFFGLSISRVDPLPHQLDAVYNHLLKSARCRFLLADDAGAGKTIMAGLLLKELKLRGLVERVLIICPANLAFQWQREMADRFQESFHILRGSDLRVQYGVNMWNEKAQLITSMDLAKREEILPSVRQADDWDLVIVDEAHRMSARDSEHKSERYRLGEILREKTSHYLLLTATPHKGDPVNFSLFLQLLDQEAYADVKSIHDAMERREAACYLRRTKEVMLNFPKPQTDGTWKAEKLFTKRIPQTVAFNLEGDEMELYKAVTHYVQRQSARAAEAGDERRARAVGFIMAMYQRRMASSTYSLRHSLLRREKALKQLLETANQLGEIPMPDVPTEDEWEEMDDAEREIRECELERATLARRKPDLEDELKEIAGLIAQAQRVEDGGHEIKLRTLKDQLTESGVFADHELRLLLFTEYRDTLDYLVAKLRSWGLTVGQIHGSMKPGRRDEEGTRLWAERNFWELKTQVLVATEAAGEGINLQCCHVLFNFDIPWNPNRLEQRMGRIHRYGQTKDCLIFNFFAQNTVEGRVLHKLMEKLQSIRDALDDDAVFNVVGEVLPSNQIERFLRDFYSGKMSADDIEARLEVEVREEDFRKICQSALEGLAKKSLNLPMLVERRAMAQERRIVPETVARFFELGAGEVGLPLTPVKNVQRAFTVGKVPTRLYDQCRAKDWRLANLARNYDRICFDRGTLEADARLEWVTPGHALFEAVRRQVGEWLPTLVKHGVRGADAIFSCLGPALESYSKFERVLTAADREVPLGGDPDAIEPEQRGFLAYVFETLSKEALRQVLGDAETEGFEEDSRMTALFLWTLQSTKTNGNGKKPEVSGRKSEVSGEEEEPEDDEDDGKSKKAKAGFSMPFDTFIRITRPMGIHYATLEHRVIEIEKGIVRLLPVRERSEQLLGEAATRPGLEISLEDVKQMELGLLTQRQQEAALLSKPKRGQKSKPAPGKPQGEATFTTLDRLHRAMLLFSLGRSTLLRQVLETELRQSQRFESLALALNVSGKAESPY